MGFAKIDFNKYENYIRIGNLPQNLAPFPTPSSIGRTLHDVDLDAYTDLKGYTQRNRIRHDVEDLTLTFNILSDDDMAYILNAISPVWFYVELIDKKTKNKKICKMCASDKQWDVHRVQFNERTGQFEEQDVAFEVSFVEQ